MEGFKASIVESWKQLTPKEKISVKDTSAFEKFDEVVVAGEDLIIEVANYVHIHIENPLSENKEYDSFVVMTTEGKGYVTSSRSFADSLKNILDEIGDCGEEIGEWKLRVFKKESSNYKGKYFLTCQII